MTDTINVTNISKVLNEENIRDLFKCVGNITNVIWTEQESEYNCTITFDSTNSVKAAVLLSGTPLGDRPLFVSEGPHSSTLQPSGPTPAKRLMTPAETIASLNAAAMKLDPSAAALSKQEKKQEELIARTVYIGNLAPQLTEVEVRNYFNQCGNIIFVKMAGNPALGIKYAFMEFSEPIEAQRAIALTGSGAMLADRPVKVGPAMNSIVKPANVAVNSDPTRIESAMSRALQAKKMLEHRKERFKSKGSNKEKSRYRRSRSRSGSSRRRRRRRRSRSRSRDRHSRHRNKEEEKRYDIYIPRFKAPPPRPTKTVNLTHDGYVWDGFQWTQPSTETIRQKSENLATKIMDVISSDKRQINPSSQQAMVQQAHQQAALLKAHLEKSRM